MLLGGEASHLSTVRRWYAEFDRGRVSLHDEIREGRPSTAINEENVAPVRTQNNFVAVEILMNSPPNINGPELIGVKNAVKVRSQTFKCRV
ncbi:hypothetical protein EVAR_52796_1 [Eumeta japonica]|uniref:Mos1 transposase HTH domain-containing protein n=1 Tax=Eumeta variegata TaxID=151549 RepID=A0A4C1Y7N7_EUMVA|nr:hypothetical protein EVAR_52796_1 [Eumeta japonica]